MSNVSIVQAGDLAAGMRLDPEYYQARYLKDFERLHSFPTDALGEIAYVTDGIHSSPDEVEENGVRYLSAKCVRSNDFALGRSIQISQSQHNANPRTQLAEGDLLITTVGTIGNAAVVQPDVLPANSDRHLGIVRLSKDERFDPYFVSTFLNSEYGRFQTLREATGNVQLNLFIEKIKQLRIPHLRCAAEVAALTRQAYEARAKAMQQVAEAERAVVIALDLEGLDYTPSLSYSSSLRAMEAGGRYGAEYYMPAKRRTMEALGSLSSKSLADYVRSIKDVWSPSNIETRVRNFDLGDAIEPFLDDRNEPVEARTIKSNKKRLQSGDVVISRLRSYLKQIAVVRCVQEIEVVGSSEFIVLRPVGDLQAETILAYLRSEPVQTVLKWSQDGTNHPRYDERVLMSIPMPSRLVEKDAEIAEFVRQAIVSRQEMTSLLKKGDALIRGELAS